MQIQASVLSPTVYTHGDAGMGCVDAKQRAYVKLTRANTMRVRSPERGGMGVGYGDDIDRIYVALTRCKMGVGYGGDIDCIYVALTRRKAFVLSKL